LRLKTILVFSFISIITLGAKALVITVNNPPDDFRVFAWDYQSNEAVNSTRKSSNFNTMNFSIPDEYVQIDRDGKINLWKSLEAWRKGTPRGSAYPRTNPEDSVTRFPFYESYDPSKPTDLPNGEYYIGLAELLRKQKEYKDMSVVSEDGRAVNTTIPPVVGLAAKLKNLSKESIDCRGNRSSVANWSAEKCLMCNCVNESLEKDIKGQVMITQVVFRRVASSYFPQDANKDTVKDNICGIISEPQQFSWVGKPSKKTIPKGSDYMKNCLNGVTEAISKGPGLYDHFHTTGVSPGWANSYIKKHNRAVGNHYFYQRKKTDNSNLRGLQRELSSSVGSESSGSSLEADLGVE
jgi:spore germination cell wall hydrolase CwlJ-like protein